MKSVLVLCLMLSHGCATLPNTFNPAFIGPITPPKPEPPEVFEELWIIVRPPFCTFKLFFGDPPRCLKA